MLGICERRLARLHGKETGVKLIDILKYRTRRYKIAAAADGGTERVFQISAGQIVQSR